jgi:hypothetical protein
MEDKDYNPDQLRKRKAQLMAPLEMQIMMCDDKNEVLLLAAAMLERGYAILRDQYGKEGGTKLAQTMIEIVDERG